MKENQTHQNLKNSDFLAWRVSNYQRSQREEQTKKIFYSRERERPSTQH